MWKNKNNSMICLSISWIYPQIAYLLYLYGRKIIKISAIFTNFNELFKILMWKALVAEKCLKLFIVWIKKIILEKISHLSMVGKQSRHITSSISAVDSKHLRRMLKPKVIDSGTLVSEWKSILMEKCDESEWNLCVLFIFPEVKLFKHFSIF